MLNLSNTCRHPDNGQQYVFNGMGGKNNSPEGHAVSCSCAAITPRCTMSEANDG